MGEIRSRHPAKLVKPYHRAMKLSTEDADLFFDLMWSLQFFVKRKLGLVPEITTLAAYRAAAQDKKMLVRQALYDNISLIDAFVQENPERLPADRLASVESWQRFVAGEFYIERLLKRHAIFIGSGDNVYAVLALYDSFRDIFAGRPLPIFVKAVLLPFKGKIVYDGLLESYNL